MILTATLAVGGVTLTVVEAFGSSAETPSRSSVSGERPVSPDTPAEAQDDLKQTAESLVAHGWKVDLVTD